MKNALYLTSHIWPLNNGGALHDFGNCMYLSEYLDLRVLGLEKNNTSINIPDNNKFKVILCNDKSELLERVFSNLREYEILFFTFELLDVAKILVEKNKNIKVIYISHNVEIMNIADELEQYNIDYGNHGLLHKIKQFMRIVDTKHREKNCLKISNYVYSISKNDAAMFKKIYHIEDAKIVFSKPMILYENKIQNPKSADGKSILFVGNLWWYPNIRGLERFLKNVWNNFEMEKIVFKVVGAYSEKTLNRVNPYKNVVFCGRVPDLSVYYLECGICVIPIWEGTGAKLKVLEALSYGIPIISTKFAIKDYEGLNEIVIAVDSDTEFVDAIANLLCDEEKRKNISQKEVEYYKNYMSDNSYVRNNLINELKVIEDE